MLVFKKDKPTGNMLVHYFQGCLLSSAFLILVFSVSYSQASLESENKIKSATFLSPKIVLAPGSVEDRDYYNIDFPRGHIAVKSFNAEVIDEAGNPVPLYETYLHHWIVGKYYQIQDVANTDNDHKQGNHIFTGNSGLCQGDILGQLFGLGSETRRTDTHVPDPYGIETGNPAEIPAEYEERWFINVHAIDMRGVEDRLGCTECRCDLYNVTFDEDGQPLRPDYKGGLFCCYHNTRCKVRQGFVGARRSLYLHYTVKWVDWDSFFVPVQILILDVTDTGKRLSGSTGIGPENGCQLEYEVEACSATVVAGDGCIDTKRTSLTMPTGGYVIYGVAHQHMGGTGSTLYGKDGSVICTSVPIYGEGKEAGNEAGYIVGISTCYLQPGSVHITAGETLILESNYSSTHNHTGVMGLFYILVADQTPEPMTSLHGHSPIHVHENTKLSTYGWKILVLLGLAITIAVGVRSLLAKQGERKWLPINSHIKF